MPVKKPSDSTLDGIIKTITFHNEETGFSVLKIETQEALNPSLFSMDASVITATGAIIDPQKGEHVTLTGTVETHPKFGPQFQFTHYIKDRPLTKEGMIDYLSSDLFKGIGPATAEVIMDALGEDALSKIRENPDLLTPLKIPPKVKANLPAMLEEHAQFEHIRVALFKYGLTVKMVKSLIQVYGDQALDRVEKNPYRLIQDVRGVGFERADVIAAKMGIEKDDERRIEALFIVTFEHATFRRGHTHIDKETLLRHIAERLRTDALYWEEDTLTTHLNRVIQKGHLIVDEPYITRPIFLEAETFIAEKLRHLSSVQVQAPERLEERLEMYQEANGIALTDEQRMAIQGALSHSVYMISGGPGTGKTTIIKGIIAAFKEMVEAEDIALIAPTGKAAKRIEEATGFKAATFHRFLKIRQDMFTPPEKVTQKVIIIDEISMVDTVLFFTLLKALKEVRLIIVGDDAQLPSVSPGQVFKDLLKTDLKRTHLTTIHRQAAGSKIIQLAQMIRLNTVDLSAFQTPSDLVLKPLDESDFYDRLSRMLQYYLDEGYALHDISVIIPVYAGKIGIDEVNQFIQKTFNPAPFKTLKNRIFKRGDKVHQLINDYDHDVMNGDQGIITDIASDHVTVAFDEKTVAYDAGKLDELRLAYAMSVHKSQGSGYPVVILPVFKAFRHMLTQPLIYTALTRAIDACVITGDLALFEAAATIFHPERTTLLSEKMQAPPQTLSPYDFLD